MSDRESDAPLGISDEELRAVRNAMGDVRAELLSQVSAEDTERALQDLRGRVGSGSSGGPIAARRALSRSAGAAAATGLGGILLGVYLGHMFWPITRVERVPQGVERPVPVVVVRDAAGAAATTERALADASVATAASRGEHGANAEPESSLAREQRILDRVRITHDVNDQLHALDEHRRLFPSGQLAGRREVMRVEVLLAAGRREEARAACARVLAHERSAALRQRAQRLLEASQ